MKAKGGTWTFDDLNKFIANPKGFVPGTAMGFAGIQKDSERADVIAYLQHAVGQSAFRCRRRRNSAGVRRDMDFRQTARHCLAVFACSGAMRPWIAACYRDVSPHRPVRQAVIMRKKQHNRSNPCLILRPQ